MASVEVTRVHDGFPSLYDRITRNWIRGPARGGLETLPSNGYELTMMNVMVIV